MLIFYALLFPGFTLAAPLNEAQPKTPDHFHFRLQAFPNTHELYASHLAFSQKMTQLINKIQLPQAFAKKETFPWPKKNSTPTTVRYGNSDFGFFSSKRFRIENNQLTFDFIPPTYRKPIEFQVQTSTGTVSFGKRQYKSPIGDLFTPFISTYTPTTVPFFILDWKFDEDLAVVVNRLGEVVWIDNLHLSDPYMTGFEFTSDGDFIFLRLDAYTNLKQVSAFGEVKRQKDFSDSQINLPSSHTVQYLKDTNEIVFLSYDCRKLPWWKEFIPLFSGIKGWLRLFTLPRRSYRSGRLIRMKLDDFSYKEIWNSYRTYSPDQNPSLSIEYVAMADRFQDAKTEEDYRLFMREEDYATWCSWKDGFASAEWTHENSAQYIPGKGYLISVRNLNELIFIDEDGNTKWRMGEGEKDHDYWFERDGSSFSMQHSARFLKDGRILVYDNNSPYRGFSGIRDGNKLKILNVEKKGKIKPDWTFEFWLPHSTVRGSAEELRNGHFFTYTSGNPDVPSEILEIDPNDRRIYGHIQLRTHPVYKGFEIRPFYAFAGDEYLSETAGPAASEEAPSEHFEFSY